MAVGILSWLISGRTDRVSVLYSFPKCAMPITYAFVAWGIFFAVFGCIISGILFSCEKYRRNIVIKITFLLLVAYLCALCVYPLFFRAMMPMVSFFMILLAILFCIFAMIDSFKFNSLWTICIFLEILWLIYNAYTTLAFIFIN